MYSTTVKYVNPLLVVALVLPCWMSAALSHAADDPVLAKTTADMQSQMELAAKNYVRFATVDIINNRPTTRQWPQELIAEQTKLLADLKKWSAHPQSLTALIQHPDAKVRTLVLGAIFVREDPSQLPLIASLKSDKAPTFTNVHASQNSGGFSGDLKDIQKSRPLAKSPMRCCSGISVQQTSREPRLSPSIGNLAKTGKHVRVGFS
jgi:hypothetical protein